MMRKSIFVTLCFSALTVLLCLFCGAAEIGTANDLLTLMNTPSMWSGDYTLTSDIDLASATNGLSQATIGNSGTAFSGTFDGAGHTISGVNISGSGNVALFGYAGGAVIRNLTAEGTITSTGACAAGVVARVSSASITIENCINRCTVSGSDSTGGIVGRLEPASLNATISGCKNEGTITGARYCGGIVGFSSQTSGATIIEKCRNEGSVSGTQGAAGVVGFFRVYTGASSKCYVRDCINTGNIHTTAAYAGGILGWGHNKNYAYTVTRCFNSGSVSSDAASYVRPIAGVISKATYDAGKMSACYYTATGAYTSESDCYANLCETYVADATAASNLAGLGENWVLVDGHSPELAVFHTHDYQYVPYGANHKYICYCGDVALTEEHHFVAGVCAECGAEYVPCSHPNKYEVIEAAATCVSTGSKYEYCPDCEIKVSENIEIPINPNNHADTLTMARVDGSITYTCAACGAVAYTDSALLSTVYVSASGKELTGTVIAQIGTALNPFKEFTEAMQYAAYCDKNVTITILDTATTPTNYQTPAFSSTITVTGGTLNTHTRFIMNGPMVFEHICFSDTGNPFIAAQEHKIVMGEGITVPGGGIYLVGGYENISASNSDIPATGFATDMTIRSGKYYVLGGANRYLSGAYSGTIQVTIGKTDPSDTLVISNFATASFSAEGGNGVSATVIIDGDVDSIGKFYPISHKSSGVTGHFDVDIVICGTSELASSNVVYYGTNYTVTVYADDRVDGAETFAAVFTDAENVMPYKRFCLKVNGVHPDANGDTVCDNCGASTICAHEYGEWRQTAAANCTSPAVYTWYCFDCKDLIEGMTQNGGSVAADDHVADTFVWSFDGSRYQFTCASCGALVRQSEAPSVYVSASRNDKCDGRTPQKAVATLTEAVTRIANVGGKIVLVGSYTLDGDVTLPAYSKQITFSGYDADNGDVPGGFAATANLLISLGGTTRFDAITFAGGKRYMIAANWNDLTFGKVYSQSNSSAYVILGGGNVVVSDNTAKSAVLTITEDATRMQTLTGEITRDRFYARIYLGSLFGADNIGVANKTAVLNATDADIGVLYTMSTSGAHKLTTTDNCETTVNLYGRTVINQGRTGDYNVAYSTSKAALKRQTLNFFDNSSIFTNYYIRNCENTVINVSTKAEGRTLMMDIPFAFYAFGDFAANDTQINVAINYSTHCYSSALASPLVFVNKADTLKACTVNAADECVYVESITHAATPTASGTKLYACTCGRSYTETYAYSCADATHIYTAKADGSFECGVCGAKTNAVIGDIRFALAPATTDNRSVTLTLSLDASEIAAARITIKAPAGFTFAGASIPEVSGFTVDAAAVGGTATIALLSTSAENTALDTSLTLSYSIDETVVYGDYVFDLSVPEAYDEDGEPIIATPVGAVVTALLVTPVVTNTDAYIDELGRGNVRIITTAHLPDVKDVTGYGTYFIPLAVFTGDGEALTRALRLYSEGSLTDGETYSADLMGIPEEFANETILAISFCIVGGEEVATAQYTFSVAELIG